MYGIGYDKDMVKSKRIGKGYKAITSDPHFQKEQEIFEHNLGKYAFKNSKANAAIDEGIDKMKKVLLTYYQEKYADIVDAEKRKMQIYMDAFANKDDRNSAGQIAGTSYSELCKVINELGPNENEMDVQVDLLFGEREGGNLREKMTAFYNAAYYKGYKDKVDSSNPATNFKHIVWSIANGETEEDSRRLQQTLGLDESVLDERAIESGSAATKGNGKKHRHRLLCSIYNLGFFHTLIAPFNKEFGKRNHAKDPYDMGLISFESGGNMQGGNIFQRIKYRWTHGRGQMLDNIRSGSELIYRDSKNTTVNNEGQRVKSQNLMRRNLTYYDEMGLNLSTREKEFIVESVMREYIEKHKNEFMIDEDNETTDEYKSRLEKCQMRLSFYEDNIRAKIGLNRVSEERAREFKRLFNEKERENFQNEVDNTKSSIFEGKVFKDYKKSGFLGKMEKTHGVRIVNGISMTTARMLKTAKWLGVSNLKNFRLALMGWMLPTDDHSLWEIIIGSHNVGVKGEEDMTDVPSLDQTVDPLSQSELRNNVCSTDVRFEPMFPHEIVYWRQRYGRTKDDGYRKMKYREVSEYAVRKKAGDLFDVGDEERNSRGNMDFLEEIGIAADKKDKAKFNHSVQKSAVLTYTSNDYQRINLATNMVSSRGIVKKVNNMFFKEEFNKARGAGESPKEIQNRYEKRLAKAMFKPKEEREAYEKAAEEEYINSYRAYFEKQGSIEWVKEKYKIKIKDAKKADNKEEREKMIREAKEEYEKGVQDYKKDYKEHLDDCIAEANVIYDSLAGVEKRFKGKVYTGTWKLKAKNYKPGTVEEIKMFKSSSKSIGTAKNFIGGLGGLSGIKEHTCDNVLQEVELKGKYGIDLTSEGVGKSLYENKYAMSVYNNNEMEVLNMPGAKWKVTEVYNDVPLEEYKGSSSAGVLSAREAMEEKADKFKKDNPNKTGKGLERDLKNLYKGEKIGTLVKMEEV